MADIDLRPLPTSIWPERFVMADFPGLILEASFGQSVPAWKVQGKKGKDALPDLVSSGTVDKFEAAKAAALHVAEESNDLLAASPRRLPSHRRSLGQLLPSCSVSLMCRRDRTK